MVDKLPDTWADKFIFDSIKKETKIFFNEKFRASKKFGIENLEAVLSDIHDVTLPEIFAKEFCIMSGNGHLASISSPLQAFQTYGISIYDMISDNHEYHKGQPTFLKIYGIDYLKNIKMIYDKIIMDFTNQLEDAGVLNAKKNILEQYSQTIEADKIRNKKIKKLPHPQFAIKLQDKIAGIPSSKIALLSNSPGDLESLSSSLANSMSTLDDFIDLYQGEDLKDIKVTIPLCYLQAEIDSFVYLPKKDVELFLSNLNFNIKIKEYVSDQLLISNKILNKYSIKKNNILKMFVARMNLFLEEYPKKYL